ncbi:MAG: ABC transporter permease [Betaproteobacteria bacterium]|nr:ABC transporter permease [Betaproteobacteria bacterium]
MEFALPEFLNAFRSVTRQYRRSLFGILAVAFGVIAMTLATGFIEWILWATREGTIQNGLGHVQVMRPGYLVSGQANPSTYLLPPNSAEQAAIAAHPTVRAIAPRLAFSGLISHGEATISFVGEGVEPEAEKVVSKALEIAAGMNLSAEDPFGIIVGVGLAQALGVKPGDVVVLLANTPSGGINAVEGKIRGLFSTISKDYDDSALRVPLALSQKLLRVSGAHRWILAFDDTAHARATTEALRTRFQPTGFEFLPWYDLADFYNKAVALLSRQIQVVRLIIAVIIILSISNTMMMSVLERTAEVGTCMALGHTTRMILRKFLYEGLAIGLIGGIVGLALAWALATAISAIGIPMPPPPGMSKGYSGEIVFTWGLAVGALALALATTLLSSLYPAWRASRMNIVDALRHSR